MKTPVLVLIATTLALCLPTEARVGSSSGGRSSSSSYSSSARSSPSAAPAPARAGGGNSIGMQRTETVNNAKASGTTTYNGKTLPPAATGPQYPNGVNPYANYQGNTPPAPGYVRNSAGSWVLPALAGAAAGYAISQATSSHQPTVINNNGTGAAPQNTGGTATYPNGEPMPAAPSSSGGMGLMGGLLMLALFAGVLYFAFRFFKQRPQRPALATTGADIYQTPWTNPSNNPLEAIGEEVKGMANAFYSRIQALNNAGDLNGLQAITTPDVYKALADDIQYRSEPSQTEVVRMETRLLDVSEEGGQIVASVQYIGAVREGYGQPEERVDEVYHFVKPKFGGSWKLAGIENGS